MHILSAFVFCLAGALQFLPSFGRHHPAIHRLNGRVVAIAGCMSAATGLWMTHVYTFPAGLQGSLLYWVRMVLGSAMILLIVWAVIAIRSRDRSHTTSMLRAYAIGQGASTQTVMGIAWIIVVGSEATGSVRDVIMISAWNSLNLAIAEVLIGRLPKARMQPAGPAATKWRRAVIDGTKKSA